MELATVTHVPNVKDLHPAIDGEALIVSGFGATWDLDRVGDRFDPHSLDKALATFMATNPVVLFKHDKDRPPIGKVIEARVDRERGVWFKALLPKPPAGSWSEHIWWSVKKGLMRAFSVGGRWSRQAANGYNRIVAADLHELSLAPVAINGMAHADAVQSVQHVKAMPNGEFVPVDDAFGRWQTEALRACELARLELAVLALSSRW
jgi:hypothetical protein